MSYNFFASPVFADSFADAAPDRINVKGNFPFQLAPPSKEEPLLFTKPKEYEHLFKIFVA